MNIYGEKVILRALSPKDSTLLLELINDPETENMLGGCSFPVSFEGQIKWIEEQVSRADVLRCIIAPKENQENGVGTVILSDIDYRNGTAQVHIKLAKNNRGKGYGKDALKAVVSYAFHHMRIHCVYASVLESNERSQRLFTSCGFQKEGLLRARVYKLGSFKNFISYSILNEND